MTGTEAGTPARARLLMVAYHFPPVRGSSGLQRTISFARYLPDHEWEPLILSASPRAYERTGADQLADIAPGTVVRRAFALDTARHLRLLGRYPRFLALPDRWVSWCLGAIPTGLWMIRRYSPAVIWSTYPIATAHLIGLLLHRLTGIPWVADFRDSMTEEGYPRDAATRRVFQWVERETVRHCARAVFTAPKAREMYANRYPALPESRWHVIENGYDERAFDGLLPGPPPGSARPLTLVHSGILYPQERDPSALFDAIAALRDRGVLDPETFQLVLRGTGHDAYLGNMLAERKLHDLVNLAPARPYREALEEMMAADGLLILQSEWCNHQIPAKLYEYLRARRPILALTHEAGDTAGALRAAGAGAVVDLMDPVAVANTLERFLDDLRAHKVGLPADAVVQDASREGRTRELASLLTGVRAA